MKRSQKKKNKRLRLFDFTPIKATLWDKIRTCFVPMHTEVHEGWEIKLKILKDKTIFVFGMRRIK